MDNQNKVENQEQPVQKDINMNDSDYLNDMLATEKNMSNSYSIALNEASNDTLYNELFKVFQETQEQERKLFNLLFKKGWYKLEKADETKISTILTEHETKTSELA